MVVATANEILMGDELRTQAVPDVMPCPSEYQEVSGRNLETPPKLTAGKCFDKRFLARVSTGAENFNLLASMRLRAKQLALRCKSNPRVILPAALGQSFKSTELSTEAAPRAVTLAVTTATLGHHNCRSNHAGWTAAGQSMQVSAELPPAHLNNIGLSTSAPQRQKGTLPLQLGTLKTLQARPSKNKPRTNPGCARCSPRSRWLLGCNRDKPAPSIPHRHPMKKSSSKICKDSKLSLHVAYKIARTRMPRFVVRRSQIADLGVYITEPVRQGELLMEYAGEVVRQSVADIREQAYISKGVGVYFFSLDDGNVVDATRRGNIARFVNHSCRPNCETKLRYVEGQQRVLLFSARPIRAAEELTYDYKLSGEFLEPGLGDLETVATWLGVDLLKCNCGASNCRGYL